MGLRKHGGVVPTLAVVAMAQVLASASISLPNLSVLLLLAILFATFSGGRRAGLASSVLGLSYYAYYESIPGRPFRYTPGDLERVLTTSGAIVIGVVLLTRLHGRIERLLIGERALRTEADAARARVADILESVTDGFFAVDAEWRYTYVNRKAEELVRRSRTELLGKSIWEAFPPLVGSRWDWEYRRALASGETAHFEEYYPPLDAWFETHAYPSPAGLTIYLADVTTRKRAEIALETRVRQQAEVAALGLLALSTADFSTVLDAAVRAVASGLDVEMAKALELSEDGASLVVRAGVGWKEGVVGAATVESRAGSQAGYTLSSHAPVIVEDLRAEKRFSGPPLLTDHDVCSGMSVPIEGRGRPFGVLGAHTRRLRRFTEDDVNFLQAVANVLAQGAQRRLATEELTESESRFRLLAETVHDAFFIVDLETGRTEYVSPAYERIWGRRYDPLTSDSLEAVHPEDRSAVAASLEGTRFGEPSEYRIVRPDGSIRWISSRVFPVETGAGPPRRAVGIASDVTERKEAEVVTGRLQEEQLARRVAEAGLRARDDVLALVSHDLRSPLGTIILASTLLETTAPLPGAQKSVGTIKRAATRMSRLVEDLLDVARVEAGKMTLRTSAVDLREVFAEVREAVETQASSGRSASRSATQPASPPSARTTIGSCASS